MKNLNGKVHVFCPNGCCFTSASETAPWDEFEDCGARMTPDAEDAFDSAHESFENILSDDFNDDRFPDDEDEMAILVIP